MTKDLKNYIHVYISKKNQQFVQWSALSHWTSDMNFYNMFAEYKIV